jgi:hypothetical protein
MPDQFSNDYAAYMQLLAETNPTNAILYEPRAFFDFFELNGLQEVQGHGEVFKNGEDFPIVLTHLTAATAYRDQANAAVVDERLIQRVGLYLNFHDQYYMNSPQQLGGGTVMRAAPIPTWANVPTGGPEALTRGTSSWRFPRPFILSVRDTLKVRVRLYSLPATANVVPISVSFTGIGLLSKQPYFLSGSVDAADIGWRDMNAVAYANDGAEPIMVTDMVVQVQGESLAVDPTGDSRRVYVSVRQVGNGTGAEWFHGPVNVNTPGILNNLIPNDAMPAVNLGVKQGRCLVHQFPHPLIWEPGEGITATMQASTIAVGDAVSMNLGLLGFIMVQ